MVRFLYLVVLIVAVSGCKSRLIKKEKLAKINDAYANEVYFLKKDIIVAKGEVYKKGMLVKIYVESTPTMLKVKCFPAEETREKAIGQMILYKVNEDVESESFTKEEIDTFIEPVLQKYEQKGRKK